MDVYSIDLTTKPYRIGQYSESELAYDLEYFGAKTPEGLQDEGYKIFRSAIDADNWLERFKIALKNLSRITDSDTIRERKAMLMRRVDLARIVMGEKLSTERDDNRMSLRKGDKIRFHDQTFNVPVEVTRVLKVKDFYRFEFKLDNP